MRFFISRIVKNFPFINKYWISYLKKMDEKHYAEISSKYAVIPFGNYCLPRVITALSGLKPKKAYGEKSFPFDLVFSNVCKNIALLENRFEDFFDDVCFDESKKYYVNNKYDLFFNHDGDLTFEEFKSRYTKRIQNLFECIQNKSLHLYFLIALLDFENEVRLETISNAVKKYRKKEDYDIIIINQSHIKMFSDIKNIHIIDLTQDREFKKLNKNGIWINFVELKTLSARLFFNKINSKLRKIIK